ncbi:MAG: hypothetical protein ACRDWW_06890 [Acidimicrobiales bacterium]
MQAAGRTSAFRGRPAWWAHDRESRKLNLLTRFGWSVAHLTSSMSPPGWLDAVLSVMPADAFLALRARRAGAGVRSAGRLVNRSVDS